MVSATVSTNQSIDIQQNSDISTGAAPSEAAPLRDNAQEALVAAPLEQDPKPTPQASAPTTAQIQAILNNTSLSAEDKLKAIQGMVNPPAPTTAQSPAATVASSPSTAPAPTPKPEEKPAAETKPAAAQSANDPLAALESVEAKKATAPAKPADPTAQVESVQAAPAKAPEQKNGFSFDPLAALENVVPIQRTIADVKKAAETVTETKPAPEAKAEPKPEVKPEAKAEIKVEAKPEAKAEPKPAPAAKVETSLSPELLAKAQAIGTTLSDDFGRTSYDYRKIAQKAELTAAKVPMDAETRKLFNEQIARTFAERTVPAHEGKLADFSERSSGSDLENSMRYHVMGRILGAGDPQKGNEQAGLILKEVASNRINELLAEKSTYEDGPDRIKMIEGLAKRFKVEKPTESIINEKQEVRESALEEFRAVLGATGLSPDQKEQLLESIVGKANKGIDLFSKNLLSEKDLAPIFAEQVVEELENSRGEEVKKRRARLNEISELAENFDVENEPAVKSALDSMKLEIAGELLYKGVEELLNDKKLSWNRTAEEIRELRAQAIELSGAKTEEANRIIEKEVKAFFAAREVNNLAHAHELMDGVDAIDNQLGFSDAAVKEMKGSIRADVVDRLDEMLAADRQKVDEILLSENGGSLDSREKKARNYIAEVADIGDDTLAHEIKVRLGAQAVETILDGDIKSTANFETRADEAEDLAHNLGIKDEAAQVVARIAEKRFSREPQSEKDIAQMKDELYELMQESKLLPKDIRGSQSELRKDAGERLVAVDKQLDERLAAMQEAAREKARLAAQARLTKAYDDIKAVLGNDEVSIQKRIAEVKKIQQSAGLPAGEVKKIVEAKIDDLAARNDRRSTASASKLASSFGVEML